VAEWAGNSAEIVIRVYARCVAGMEDVYIARVNATLGGRDLGRIWAADTVIERRPVASRVV